ncbi:MAG TPA: PilN domain-containing protein [Gemmatimonadaceae bacterium]|nr:PilN domain-containing protein [Gemmatimonadaceae bacterium]
MIQINLLPGAKRRTSSSGGGFNPKDMLGSVGERVKDKFLVAAIAAVIVAAALGAFMFTGQARKSSALAERERTAIQDSARFATVLRARIAAETERDAVLRQLAVIQSIDDTRFMWSHILEEISRVMPAYTWLTSVAQTSSPPSAAAPDSEIVALQRDANTPAGRARLEKARREKAVAVGNRTTQFRIIGHTVDIQALTRLMRDLESSPFVQNVNLARSDLVTSAGKEVTEFQLDASSERPPAEEIRTLPLSVRVP